MVVKLKNKYNISLRGDNRIIDLGGTLLSH